MEVEEFDEEEEWTEPAVKVVQKKKVPVEHVPPQDELEFQLAAQRSEEDKIAAGHYYTDNDGVVFEWDEEKRAWFPRVTEDFLAAYQMSYGVSTEPTEAPVAPVIAPPPAPKPAPKPRQPMVEKNIEEVLSDAREGQNKELKEDKKDEKKQKQVAAWFDLEDENNTWIYITGLPLCTTDEDFAALMGKYGLIKEDEESQKKRYKMYKDKEGKFKGDATCCFLRHESISLCMQMLEGCKLPEGTEKVHIEMAKFQLKGEYDPKLKPKKKKNNKKKGKKKGKQENALDWRERAGGTDLRPKEAKIVIMKHCFNPKDFLEDATLITDIRDDIKEECETIGPVKKVLIFDRHPQGVVSVKFGTHEAADEAVKKFNGRFFAGQKIEAEVYDGVTDFAIEETAMERQERLDNWHKHIEGDEKKEGAPGAAPGAANGAKEETNGVPNEGKQSLSDEKTPITEGGSKPKLTVLSMADFLNSDDDEELEDYDEEKHLKADDDEESLKEEIERMKKSEDAMEESL